MERWVSNRKIEKMVKEGWEKTGKERKGSVLMRKGEAKPEVKLKKKARKKG